LPLEVYDRRRRRGHATVAHFQRCAFDRDTLGAVEPARPDWPPGSIVYRGGDEPTCGWSTWSPDPERFDVLVVDPV
jgi:hypothetical protein